MRQKASELLDRDIDETPIDFAPLIISAILAIGVKSSADDHLESWSVRTKAGKVLWMVELLVFAPFWVLGILTAVAYLLIGVLILLPGLLADGYRRVAYKTNKEESA